MKLLLLGSLISDSQMEYLNNNSKVKASIAPVNYETMLAKGIMENGVDLDAISVPAVAAYPNSILKKITNRHEVILGKINVQWVPFLNIQGFKQITIKRNIRKLLKRWLVQNKDIKDKAVLMYSIYPPYTEPAIKLCKKNNCHLSVIIADLPEYMYSWKKTTGLRAWYTRKISKEMIKLQGCCDSYILFTKPMAYKMGIHNKPFIVSEGFCDGTIFNSIGEQKKYNKTTILYGGNLSELYGIRNLVNGFMNTNLDVEFHIYGAGEDANFVSDCAKRDSRIKFFGRVERKSLLVALKKAHLLVVNKPTSDDYSNYSFSSKILEYMTSGTPLLTTKVGGMPKDYYDYVFFFDSENCQGITNKLEQLLSGDSSSLLMHKGLEAKSFALNNKNYLVMTKEIVNFLEGCIDKVS